MDNTVSSDTPDVFTASPAYAERFSGKIGTYFLNVQKKGILNFLPDLKGKRILEVGGAHAQMTRTFLDAGSEVWVQASKDVAFCQLQALQKEFPQTLHLITSSFFSLPFPDHSFDYVVSVRLISHVDKWKELISEMCRLANDLIIIDYPPCGSFNVLYPLLFRLKKWLEGNSTRTFLCFNTKVLKDVFQDNDFQVTKQIKQFFLPMAFHRTLNKFGNFVVVSILLEDIFKLIGFTHISGSPALLCAKKIKK